MQRMDPRPLAEALKVNSTLNTLYLGGNEIGDDGSRALVEARRTNLTLTTYDFEAKVDAPYADVIRDLDAAVTMTMEQFGSRAQQLAQGNNEAISDQQTTT